MALGFPPVGRFPLVNAYPKSGGSWMAQLLSEAFDVMVSLYYHRLLGGNDFSDRNAGAEVCRTLGIDDPADIRTYLACDFPLSA